MLTSVRGTPRKYKVLRMPGRRRPKKLEMVMNSSSDDTAPRKKDFSVTFFWKPTKVYPLNFLCNLDTYLSRSIRSIGTPIYLIWILISFIRSLAVGLLIFRIVMGFH